MHYAPSSTYLNEMQRRAMPVLANQKELYRWAQFSTVWK
jgi:hypothetical protein